MKTFQDLLRRLEALDWSQQGRFDPGVLGLLGDVGRRPRFVYDTVTSWSAKSLDRRQLSCHETSTHYKWFMHYHRKLRFKVWLHQYKLAAERRLGHAEVPHNHRYSLASVILNGGFTHHSFDVVDGVLNEAAGERRRYQAGAAYMVAWSSVHKLSDLEDGTLTLVIESPPARHFSEAYYSPSGEPQTFYDFVGLHPSLAQHVQFLSLACDPDLVESTADSA